MVEGRNNEPGSASAARVPSDAPLIGNGRYAITAKIAEGGMAGVYRGWDHKLKVWRAIKILLPEYAGRDSLRSRFETEAETMARLDHPNVIRVYDVGTAEALPYMVMELAEGGTINGWIDLHGRMPAALACDVTIAVASGLGAAHRIGVVHRDVKPHNVLVTAAGVCKVTDFGIARVLFDAGNLTRTGSTMGTIGYMAPEQRADAKVVDLRADIYALGALMFKLATGVIVTDLFLVEHEPRLLEHVAEPLREVIVRSCYHDRERRYADTDVLIRTLREVRALLPQLPADTPRLPLPPDDPSLDRSGLAFPEIAEVLRVTALRNPPHPGSPLHSNSTPAPLAPSAFDSGSHRAAYTMSRPKARARSNDDSDTAPSWVERSPNGVPEAQRPFGSAGSAARTPFRLVEPPIDAEPSLLEQPVPPETEPRMSSSVKLLAVAAIGSWVLLAVAVGWGSWSVGGAAERALAARERLYETVTQERGLLPELAEKGAPQERLQPISELYDRFLAAKVEPERGRAAVAYVRAIREEATRTLAGAEANDLTVSRTTNVDRAFTSWAEAQREWIDATWWPSGRLAVNLGLAPAP